jgi:hypothetical protein
MVVASDPTGGIVHCRVYLEGAGIAWNGCALLHLNQADRKYTLCLKKRLLRRLQLLAMTGPSYFLDTLSASTYSDSTFKPGQILGMNLLAQFGFQGVAHVPWREGRTPCIGHLFRRAQWAILTP